MIAVAEIVAVWPAPSAAIQASMAWPSEERQLDAGQGIDVALQQLVVVVRIARVDQHETARAHRPATFAALATRALPAALAHDDLRGGEGRRARTAPRKVHRRRSLH